MSETLTNATLTALATYRVTRLIVEDEITSDLRDKVHSKFPPESTKIGYLFTCPWCISMYVAPVVHFLPKSVKTALAASAATGIIAERVTY